MAISLRDIARRMDPVRPADRLRGTADELGDHWLAERELRWIADDAMRVQLRGQPNLAQLGLAHKRDKGIAQQHRALSRPSLREIGRRHEGGAWLRFLYFNTWLINAPAVMTAPAREARRREIGRALAAGDYDVIGLVEVFRDPEKDAIRNAFGDRRLEGVNGPAARTIGISSGLWTLLVGDRVARGGSERRPFEHQGGGEDSLANKGFLHVEIGVGDGLALDFFTTHLHAREEDTRRDQIAELTDYIADTRRRKPSNLGIVAGDFNVGFDQRDSRSPDEHEGVGLYRSMAACGYHDAWLTHGGLAGSTTWDETDLGRGELRRRSGVTVVERFHGAAQGTCRFDPRVRQGDRFCDDYATTATFGLPVDKVVPGNRIDYVFVEAPSSDHAFSLDVSRIRRRHFWRGSPHPTDSFKRTETYDTNPGQDPSVTTPHFMSDHLGLEFECLVCRR